MNPAKSKRTADVIKADLTHIKDTLAHAAKDARNSAMRRRDDLQDTVANRISDKPFKSVLIAALSGVLFGLVVRKKRR